MPTAVQVDEKPAILVSLAAHWPEYLMEAANLGIFMISACIFGVLLEHPASPLNQALQDQALTRRALAGVAMGLTAVGIFLSPWGKRSGAHMNPAVTLTFFTLGKISPWDAAFYVVFQFLGGIAGVRIAELLTGAALGDSTVNYVVTLPGPLGQSVAFAAEVAISLVLMLTVLFSTNSKRVARLTPFIAGLLIAVYIIIEAPLSGMSMNPARTLGSALAAAEWTGLWIYFTAPLLGMLLAGFIYRHSRGPHRVFCAKFHHHNLARCIFRCNHHSLESS